jgi:hypothetical protein
MRCSCLLHLNPASIDREENENERGIELRSFVVLGLPAATSFPLRLRCKSTFHKPAELIESHADVSDPPAKTESRPPLRCKAKVRRTPATRPSSESTRPALPRLPAGNRLTRDIRLPLLEGTFCLESSEWLEAPTATRDRNAPHTP